MAIQYNLKKLYLKVLAHNYKKCEEAFRGISLRTNLLIIAIKI